MNGKVAPPMSAFHLNQTLGSACSGPGKLPPVNDGFRMATPRQAHTFLNGHFGLWRRRHSMLKRSMMVLSAVSIVAVPTASEAHRHHGYYDNNGYGDGRGYYQQQGYYPQQAYGYDNRYYGRTNGYRQHRCSGTTGTIVGAGAGALLGRSLGRGSGYYHQNSGTTGTILGAALGALVGRQVGKSTC